MKRSKVKNPHSVALPKSFPAHFPRPSEGFLRNEPPYQESFQAALNLSYRGFVVDENVVGNEDEIQNHLQSKGQWFRQDVTQPFGLGTKCAKTYVTRCLMGDSGTTYKYLGLRMFAHAWTEPIQTLRTCLTERTKVHLRQMEQPKGRAAYDVCLINCMEASSKLKSDDSTNNRTAVSWHADSSLEHYSTIAVYQTLLVKTPTKVKDEWSIGLRVAPFSEGPQTGTKGTSGDHESTPPIAISLPSNSAYYLLDDFNHHHQHTVFTNATEPSVQRYSLTFRLLREGHTVQYQLERCRKIVGNFNKKGTKVFRAEQLLLTEIESEWLRQFYIQGSSHHTMLQEEWGDSLRSLWKYWSVLEQRTYQILHFFRNAAVASRCERSNRKQKKSLESCQVILERESVTLGQFVGSFVSALAERDTIRKQWRERESEGVFRTVPEEQRPMPLPAVFMTTNANDGTAEQGFSPLPEDLSDILVELKQLPDSFESTSASGKTDHARNLLKSIDWSGWGNFEFALELQSPWAEALLNGKKTIETRSYTLPGALIGKRIFILRTPSGRIGKSALGDKVLLPESKNGPWIAGWCIFESIIEYTGKQQFENDESRHLVEKSSGYGWKDDTRSLFGWVVSDFRKSDSFEFSHADRRFRSLFQLSRKCQSSKAKRAPTDPKVNGRARKKRRF